MQPDQQALRIFQQQAGVVHRKQLLALDFSPRQIDYRLNAGAWEVIRRSTYFHSAFANSTRSALFALTLGEAGHVSHRYGSRLYGLDPMLKAPAEVTTRHGLGIRFDGIIVHESKQLHLADLTFVDGLPVSGIERTIMDCCAVVKNDWSIASLIDSARSKNLTDMERLGLCLQRHARRGRDGTVRFRRVLKEIEAKDRIAIGPISRKAAQIVTAGGLPRPRHEVRIFDRHGRFIAQVDSFWPNGYVHQYDGFTYHRSRRAQTKKDIEQRSTLRMLGLVVDEFTSEHVFYDPAYLLSTSRQGYAVAERALTLRPPQWTIG